MAQSGRLEHGLEVEHADLMTSRAAGLSHQLQAQRLESQVDLRVHEATRMNEQELDGAPSPTIPAYRIDIGGVSSIVADGLRLPRQRDS